MQQLKDNIATYEESKPLNAKEMELILSIAVKRSARRQFIFLTPCIVLPRRWDTNIKQSDK